MRGRSSSAPRQASSGRITARKPSAKSGVAVRSTNIPAVAAPAPAMARRELARRKAGARGLLAGNESRAAPAARAASAP